VISVDTQVHGYRQGHQLLASSISLSKTDQSVVDRLSDVAGPLRPREQFEPYLTGYPLPGGLHYVLARTWQDLTVPRAGCVRTLSLIIPVEVWRASPNVASLAELLRAEMFPNDREARRLEFDALHRTSLERASSVGVEELLEALFLEDEKPVAVFDAPDPEKIALRILAALWPSMRSRFALSTFALAPRKIGGRDFDLLFAPRDARPKFSDWPGRRVDGRSVQPARHRWTSALVHRVFDDPEPQLLNAQEKKFVETNDADSASALRIALLWDELMGKLDSAPTAVLGLLDIANSGLVRNDEAVASLTPVLTRTVERASSRLPPPEAWDFIGAVARKVAGQSALNETVLAHVAGELAAREPGGAVALLAQPDPKGALAKLIPSIAGGMVDAAPAAFRFAMQKASADVLLSLITQGGKFAQLVSRDEPLLNRLPNILEQLGSREKSAVARSLLPNLVDDRQLEVMRPLISILSGSDLADELKLIGEANDFKATALVGLLIDQARAIGTIDDARRIIIEHRATDSGEGQQAALARTLRAEPEDLLWLTSQPGLSPPIVERLLIDTVRHADDTELQALLSHDALSELILYVAEREADDIIERVARMRQLPIGPYVRAIEVILANGTPAVRRDVAQGALQRCLTESLPGDEVRAIGSLLTACGNRLDGPWVARVALDARLGAHISNRNLLAFGGTVGDARQALMTALEQIAYALRSRVRLDLTSEAAEAFAGLCLHAGKRYRKAQVGAAVSLLPTLMNARKEPVSAIIAALFPVIYDELGRDDTAGIWWFAPFVEWDRRKAARHELVAAFMSSAWPPTDLALTACRCGDVERILRRVAKAYEGEAYLQRIRKATKQLPADCRSQVARVMGLLGSDRTAKYSWRD